MTLMLSRYWVDIVVKCMNACLYYFSVCWIHGGNYVFISSQLHCVWS